MGTDWARDRWVCDTILETVGRTPVVKLQRIPAAEGVGAEVLAKLEYFAPSASLKDRVYLRMFREAERRGELQPGMTVLECSTGNAGISCSFVAAVLGYPCTIVMPEGMSVERRKIDEAYGAQLVFTPGGESDVDLALEKLDEISRSDPERYWIPAQFENRENVVAHYGGTGAELWEQAGDRIDAFVATQGTGGTISGVGGYFKERRPEVKFYAVEPDECPLLSQGRWGSHGIEGIGDGFVPENLDLSILDGVVTVSTQDAVAMGRRLSREEGIFCGISSGANVAAVIKVARRHPKLRVIATMINDTGGRYFSTALCGETKAFEVPEREHTFTERTQIELDKYRPRWEIVR
jgi:cysteine synthase A